MVRWEEGRRVAMGMSAVIGKSSVLIQNGGCVGGRVRFVRGRWICWWVGRIRDRVMVTVSRRGIH